MHYTLLGRSGLRASELALGIITFGTDWGWGASGSESAKQLELFAEARGTLIDTANNHFDLPPSRSRHALTTTRTPRHTPEGGLRREGCRERAA